MKQRAVAIIAEYLSHRPLGRVVGLTPIADDDFDTGACKDAGPDLDAYLQRQMNEDV
jgi:hypothetical protein